MSIHIIKTTEFDTKLYNEVMLFLNKFNGPIRFLGVEYKEVPEKPNSDMDVITRVELYKYCTDYREKKILTEDDFVAVLTSRRDEKNHFSAFKPIARNIVIISHDLNWDNKSLEEKLYCAYQVPANVFKIIAGLGNKTYHLTPEGCVSDYCGTKKEILLKFKTADICVDCEAKAIVNGVSNNTMVQVRAIFEAIRTEIVQQPKVSTAELSGITINTTNYQLILNETGAAFPTKLDNQLKAIYIFFLQHPTGLTLGQFENKRSDFLELYKQVTSKKTKAWIRDYEKLNKISKKLFEGDAFSKKVNIINKLIINFIGEQFAIYYSIKREGLIYKINLPEDKIKFIN